MLRPLYRKTMALAGSPKAPAWLAVISFAESSVFPIPPDVMLGPMVLARQDKAYLYAAICTVASVAGGVLGYAIGYFFTPVGLQLLAWMGHAEGLQEFRQWFADWGLAVILVKGLTPIPYKLVTIASGLAAFSFPVFVIASMVTRGARFFLVAFLIKTYGPQVEALIEKRLYTVTTIVLVILIAAILAVKVL